MFKLLGQLWTSLGFFIMAFENIGKATVHLSVVAEETAKAYEDEARAERQMKLKALQARLDAPAAVSTTIAAPVQAQTSAIEQTSASGFSL